MGLFDKKKSVAENKQYQTLEAAKKENIDQMPGNGGGGGNFSFSFSVSDDVEKELRKPRSEAYMAIFDAIDMLSATDEEIIEELKNNVDEDVFEEFSEMTQEELLEEIKACFREEFKKIEDEVKSIMHGVLAKCYISGCDVHAIDSSGMILEHYGVLKRIPYELAKGRELFYKHPNCRCVEVYSNCCRIIYQDGSVEKVNDM